METNLDRIKEFLKETGVNTFDNQNVDAEY